MKHISYNGPAHVRQFSEADIQSLGVSSPRDLLFKRREPQEVSNELAEALLKLPRQFTDVTVAEGDNPEAAATAAKKAKDKADKAIDEANDKKVEVTGDPTASGDASGSHAATELASPKQAG